MLSSLRDAIRQAVENFRTEVNRDRLPEAADRLLRAMKSELADLEVGTRELERELEQVRSEAEREHASARTCVRREQMAREIEDEETATVARDYARRHLRRHEILMQKAEVLEREVGQRRAEYEELSERFRSARLRRESLAATAGRTDARDRLREADDLFAEMDRMADKIDGFERRSAAAREVEETLEGEDTLEGDRAHEPPGEADLESRLEELKRRMGDA